MPIHTKNQTEEELTEIQENCLLIVVEYINREGRPPTRRELLKATGQKSTNGVNQILNALEKKGFIRIEPRRRSRNIIVIRVPTKQLSMEHLLY